MRIFAILCRRAGSKRRIRQAFAAKLGQEKASELHKSNFQSVRRLKVETAHERPLNRIESVEKAGEQKFNKKGNAMNDKITNWTKADDAMVENAIRRGATRRELLN